MTNPFNITYTDLCLLEKKLEDQIDILPPGDVESLDLSGDLHLVASRRRQFEQDILDTLKVWD